MKKSGNITILVLFILVACSLLGVLTIHYINQMFSQSSRQESSLQARYSAQAGKEYAMSVLPLHGPGFQGHFETGSYAVDIFGRASLLSAQPWKSTGCTEPFSLFSGQSLLIPLFVDDGKWPSWTNVSDALFSLDFVFPSLYSHSSDELNIGLLVASGDVLHPDGVFVKTGFMGSSFFSDFVKTFQENISRITGGEIGGDFRLLRWKEQDYPYKNYLVLANRNSSPASFCLSTKIPLATDRFLIVSKGNRGDETMNIDVYATQPVPNFALSSMVSL